MDRLPQELRQQLLTLGGWRSYAVGEVLLAQGAATKHVYLLCSTESGSSACVKVVASLSSGDGSLFGIRVSGDIVGEIAAIRGSVRTATVVACSALDAYGIGESRFLDFLDRHPVAWKALACVLADRLDGANRRRLDSGAFRAEIRLARVLAELTQRHGRPGPRGWDLGVDLTQSDLGQLIGAKEDTVGRAVSHLKRRGLVVPTYRRIIISDCERLHEFAGLKPPNLRRSGSAAEDRGRR
jgi:CRP/FNR family transcriptional regulator, cyclic AMP receptor protein